MTDDLRSRVGAYDRDGQLVHWTPEAVQARMIEAATVVANTPAKIGPSKLHSAWPVFVATAQDLVDEETQERLMRFPHLVGRWENHIDLATRRHLSRETQDQWARQREAPAADAYTRAEEALLWPARYLAGRPLLADALTLWAFCRATGASLRATCKERRLRVHELRTAPKSSIRSVIVEKNLHHQDIPRRRIEAAAAVSKRLNAARVPLRVALKLKILDNREGD